MVKLRQKYSCKVKKCKIYPSAGHKGPEVLYCYRSILSLTSALDVVGGQGKALAVVPPGKTLYSWHWRLSEYQGRSGRGQKISPLTRIRSLDGPSCSESLHRVRYPRPRCNRYVSESQLQYSQNIFTVFRKRRVLCKCDRPLLHIAPITRPRTIIRW